jgi:hypothetical protein
MPSSSIGSSSTRNRHLNNGGQECKTGHVKGEKEVNEEGKEV